MKLSAFLILTVGYLAYAAPVAVPGKLHRISREKGTYNFPQYLLTPRENLGPS